MNNASGQIDFSASRIENPYLSGSFKAATIRLRAKGIAPATNVIFMRSDTRWSDLFSADRAWYNLDRQPDRRCGIAVEDLPTSGIAMMASATNAMILAPGRVLNEFVRRKLLFYVI